ncbi:hypothetical protein ELI43_36015 [Rhizobium leguminosarum]|uniref:hypothetical protein n=1 Tax=Rhizobium leguminosarum TaxID=384 RepID=UPI00103029D5|nr:hypothetical protein [Rhizobium leguminosarum]TAU35720.1 hypothetical protein ELI43_36015 [Rhizobium leguminosarum]
MYVSGSICDYTLGLSLLCGWLLGDVANPMQFNLLCAERPSNRSIIVHLVSRRDGAAKRLSAAIVERRTSNVERRTTVDDINSDAA